MRLPSPLWFWCLASGLPAQELRPLVGRVVDAAAAPVSGAEVTVAWSPASQPDLGGATTTNGVADARGYFRIPAPSGRQLWVWAIGKNDADGRYLTSSVTSCMVGTPRLEVVVDKDRLDRPVRVTGLEAWADRAPFTLRMHPVPFLDLVVDLQLDEQGSCRPPRHPFATNWLELRDAGGHPRVTDRLDDGDLKLPPPQSLPIEVVDAAGKPVADAEILHRVGDLRDWSSSYGQTQRELWAPVGKTGADGKATAVLALPQNPLQADKPRDLLLMARKPGHAPSHSGFDEEWYLDGVKLGEGVKPPVIKFTLAAAEPLAGVLKLPGRLPETLLVRWTSRIRFQNGWTHLPRSERVPVAANGAFALPLPTDAYEIAFYGPAVEMAGEDGKQRLVPLVLPTLAEMPRGQFDLGSATLSPTKFKVVAPDASPVVAVQVLVCNQVGGEVETSPAAAVLSVSAAGTGEVLVASADAWLLAVGEQGHAFARLAEAAGASVELKLEPFAAAKGRVVDDTGKPVQGARVSIFRTSSRGGGGGADAAVRSAIGSYAASQMHDVVTDAEGRFALRFLPRPGLTMQARASKDDKQSESFTVEETTDLNLVLK